MHCGDALHQHELHEQQRHPAGRPRASRMTVGGLTGRLPDTDSAWCPAPRLRLRPGGWRRARPAAGLAARRHGRRRRPSSRSPSTVTGWRPGAPAARPTRRCCCVSGYDSPLTSWDEVQTRLSAFARVCAYDRLGVGHSDPPPRRQTVRRPGRRAGRRGVRPHLQRPVVLVAHSLGGVVATTWAEAHRDDLAGLVLRGRHAAGVPGHGAAAGPGDPRGAGRGAAGRPRARCSRRGDNAEHLAAGSALADDLVVPGARCGADRRADPTASATTATFGRAVAPRSTRPGSAGSSSGPSSRRSAGCRPSTGPGTTSSGDQPGSVVDAVREVVGARSS